MQKLDKKKNLLLGSIVLILIVVVGGYSSYKKNKTISDFSIYLKEFKEELSQYMLDKNEGDYNNLITESEQALSSKDSKVILELRSSLDEFKESIVEGNASILNNRLDEIKNIDISVLSEDKRTEIENELTKCSDLIQSNKMLDADKYISGLKDTIINLVKVTEEVNRQKDINSNFDELEKLLDSNDFHNASIVIKKLKNESLNNEQNGRLVNIENIIFNGLEKSKEMDKNKKLKSEIEKLKKYSIYDKINMHYRENKTNKKYEFSSQVGVFIDSNNNLYYVIIVSELDKVDNRDTVKFGERIYFSIDSLGNLDMNRKNISLFVDGTAIDDLEKELGVE